MLFISSGYSQLRITRINANRNQKSISPGIPSSICRDFTEPAIQSSKVY